MRGISIALLNGLFLSQIAFAETQLKKIPIFEECFEQELQLYINEMIHSKMLSPLSEISTHKNETGKWFLHGPDGKDDYYWPKPLLIAGKNAPDLTITPNLTGVYDIYIQVRAVHFDNTESRFDNAASMAFRLSLDDGSEKEIVGAKGFLDYHFDTEILAAHNWDLTSRKLILSYIKKPIYLYGFRFVRKVKSELNKKTMGLHERAGKFRWLATDHVTVVKNDNMHLGFPGVVKMSNGELVVVYREATRHNYDKEGKLSIIRSKDGGQSWHSRKTLIDLPGDDRDPAIFQLSDNTVILTFNKLICTSKDFGETWTKPVPSPVSSPHGVIEDEAGDILYGGQEIIQKHFAQVKGRDVSLFGCSVYHSADAGMHWEKLGVATYSIYMAGLEDYLWLREPTLCFLPNKTLIMAIVNDGLNDGFIRIIRSKNIGKTWGKILKTSIKGKPSHLLRLNDGRLLISYGYRHPPWGVRACLSNDNGLTWDLENEIVIRMDGGSPKGVSQKVGNSDLGYPVSIQLTESLIYTVYYFNKNGSNAFIAGTFWELP